MIEPIPLLISNLISFGFSIAMFCVCLKPNHYFKYGFTLYLSVFFLTFFIQLVVLPAPDPILGCFWILPHYLFSLSCFQCSAKDAIAAPLTYSCCSSALFLLSTLLLNALQTAFFPDISANAYFFCILILMILVFSASLALVSHFTFWRILPWWLLLPCFLLFVADSFGHALVDDTFSNRTALGFSALIFSNMLIILSIWVLFEKRDTFPGILLISKNSKNYSLNIIPLFVRNMMRLSHFKKSPFNKFMPCSRLVLHPILQMRMPFCTPSTRKCRKTIC